MHCLRSSIGLELLAWTLVVAYLLIGLGNIWILKACLVIAHDSCTSVALTQYCHCCRVDWLLYYSWVLILEGKDWFGLWWFYLWPMALMGSFVAVVTIWWLIVGCRFEIARLIVDARVAVTLFWGYFLVFCCHKWHRLIALCKNRVRFLWLSTYRQLKSATKRVLSYTMVSLLWGGARNAT